jgi:hypothetical protein
MIICLLFFISKDIIQLKQKKLSFHYSVFQNFDFSRVLHMNLKIIKIDKLSHVYSYFIKKEKIYLINVLVFINV